MNNRSGFMRELDSQEKLPQPWCVDRLSNRLQFRCRRLLTIKEVSAFDDGRGLLGHHMFPSWRTSLDFVQDVTRENIHNCWVKSDDLSNIMIFQQMCIQVSQMHLNL